MALVLETTLQRVLAHHGLGEQPLRSIDLL